jgi:hypothetical protein
MGEKQNGPFQLSFNAFLKIDFQGSRIPTEVIGCIGVYWMLARMPKGEFWFRRPKAGSSLGPPFISSCDSFVRNRFRVR